MRKLVLALLAISIFAGCSEPDQTPRIDWNTVPAAPSENDDAVASAQGNQARASSPVIVVRICSERLDADAFGKGLVSYNNSSFRNR